jgi:hypothetical protein
MKYAVYGSNIICALAAMRIKKLEPNSEVFLADNTSSIGGNMRSSNFKGFAYDTGMQTYYDTGVDWADDLVREALELTKTVCTFHAWPFHDNSGLIYNNTLHANSPYIDASFFKNQNFIKKTIRSNIERKITYVEENLEDYFFKRFGITRNNAAIDFLISKYTHPEFGQQSHHFADTMPFDRIIFNKFKNEELNSSEKLRKYIAYPDRTLSSLHNKKTKFTIYPIKGGISNLVISLEKLLALKGIRFFSNVKANYVPKKNIIELLDAQNNTLKFDKLIWGASLGHFQKNVCSGNDEIKIKPMALNGKIIHIYTKKPINSFGLQYLFDIGKGPINRVTFYGEMTKKEKDYNRATFEFINMSKNPERDIKNFLLKYKLADDNKFLFSEPAILPWPLYLPKGIGRIHGLISDFLSQVKAVSGIISSDISKGSMLMGPTAKRVLKNFMDNF